MSTAYLHGVVTVLRSLAPLLLAAVFPLASTPQQNVRLAVSSVTIAPPEATVHVGQQQRFAAVVKGTDGTEMRWAVAERGGGSITEDGVYTAPWIIGIYHVVVASKAGPDTRAVAKVTVITEYDTPF